ncbi:MAG: M28 family peptidase [Anaerolineae bacterium]|nr:M28 family peptidase [Anaerolineae bacterium]
MSRRLLTASLLSIILFVTGCSLISPPERPPLPTPPATAVPFGGGQLVSEGDALLDPFTPVRPDVDPDILALMNAVSQQQLTAYIQQLGEFGTRNSFSETQSDVYGIGAARRWIFDEFNRVGQGRLQVEFQDFQLDYQGFSTPQRNIVATLPGTGNYPGVVVVGAHYDSRVGEPTNNTALSPSANDNGSGVAMLLELARLMSSRTWNQTIVFVAFAAEEQGTAGSRRFVTNSILNGPSIDLAINNDSIGGRAGIPQHMRLFAPQMETSPSGQVARYIDFLNRLYLPDFPLVKLNTLDREGRYGDHREFINAQIGAVRLIESDEDPEMLNSPQDTWDKIDYNYLANSTKNNLITIANWAGAPAPTPPPAISRMADPSMILVSWQSDPAAAGYAFSFRPIESIEMPELRMAGAETNGRVRFTGIDPAITYAVSVAPIGTTGRIGGFSPEIILPALTDEIAAQSP